MTWTYQQSTGDLKRDGRLIATGCYSGHGVHKNKPDDEALVAEGPIPRGKWKMTELYDSARVGPYAIKLVPVGHDAHGRSAFRVHGDSSAHPGMASNGCIVTRRTVREAIWTSGDRDLEVIR